MVCLKGYCGIEGYGETCLNTTESLLETCRKSLTENVYGRTLIDRCETCIAGYFSYFFYFFTRSDNYLIFMAKCDPMENSITKDFFVRSELITFFEDGQYITDMNNQLLEEGRG